MHTRHQWTTVWTMLFFLFLCCLSLYCSDRLFAGGESDSWDTVTMDPFQPFFAKYDLNTSEEQITILLLLQPPISFEVTTPFEAGSTKDIPPDNDTDPTKASPPTNITVVIGAEQILAYLRAWIAESPPDPIDRLCKIQKHPKDYLVAWEKIEPPEIKSHDNWNSLITRLQTAIESLVPYLTESDQARFQACIGAQ